MSIAAPGPRAAQPPLAPYARVKLYLKQQITEGAWLPGALMPSEADLVERFGVSRMTVNRALRELVSEGLVQRVQGVGSFMAQLARVSATLTLRDLHEEILERGHVHHALVHLQRRERAGAGLAERLGLERGDAVFHTLIVHHENGVAIQCEDRYVNPAAAPGYLDVDFTQTTPTHYLLEVAPIGEASYRIEATRPTAQEAQLLGIDESEPCLAVVRQTASRGVPVTIARLVHPGTRYCLEGRFQP